MCTNAKQPRGPSLQMWMTAGGGDVHVAHRPRVRWTEMGCRALPELVAVPRGPECQGEWGPAGPMESLLEGGDASEGHGAASPAGDV